MDLDTKDISLIRDPCGSFQIARQGWIGDRRQRRLPVRNPACEGGDSGLGSSGAADRVPRGNRDDVKQ